MSSYFRTLQNSTELLYKSLNLLESDCYLFPQHGNKIGKHRKRIQQAQYLLLDSGITTEEYKKMKLTQERSIDELVRRKLLILSTDEDYSEYLKTSYNLIKNMDQAYRQADLEVKQLIIGSISPGKLIFSENEYRT